MSVHLLLAAALSVPPVGAEPTLRERARSRDQASFPALREALSSSGAADRVEAAFGLGQFGLIEVPLGAVEPAAGVLARSAAADLLAPAVSDPDPSVRRAAVEGLGNVAGRDAESFLLAAATDYDPGVRGEAALALFRQRLLKRVPAYSPEAVARLGLLAADADSEVRWRAACAFSRWEEPRAEAALAALQSDADSRARLFAVRALGRRKIAPSVARLADADPFVRAEAVAAFSAAKAWSEPPDAVFADASPYVRAAAAAAGRADVETSGGRAGDFQARPRRFKPLKSEPSVLFETERGSFTVVLSNEAPNHAAAFADGVKKKLCDGAVWRRVPDDFIVQVDGARGSGRGEAGWSLPDEPNRLSFERGVVGAPREGQDAGGCRLFIALVPAPHLDGRRTAFGRVTSGLDVLDRLEPGDKIVSATLLP